MKCGRKGQRQLCMGTFLPSSDQMWQRMGFLFCCTMALVFKRHKVVAPLAAGQLVRLPTFDRHRASLVSGPGRQCGANALTLASTCTEQHELREKEARRYPANLVRFLQPATEFDPQGQDPAGV